MVHFSFDMIVIQDDIDSLLLWCAEWKINVNFTKTVVMFHSLTNSLPDHQSFTLNDHQIKTVNTFRDLGITISSNLSWSSHYNTICSKAYASLHLIRRTISTSEIPVKRQLYLTLIVRSKLCYCCQLWRPHFIKDITSLERVQRRSTKYILQDYDSDYRTRLSKLNILPLMYWFELQDVMFIVKCLKVPPDNFNILDHISFNNSIYLI